MSLMALGAFAEGFGNAIQDKKDRKQREEDNARMDRYISAIERQPQFGAYGTDQRQNTGDGGYGTATTGARTGGDGTLFGLIDATEGAGNYDTLFGHSQNGGRFNGVHVSDMTIGQLAQFSRPDGEYGQWVKDRNDGVIATPMGRHQIVGSTLRVAAQEMGLSPETKFTPDIQNAIADHLARRRLSGAQTAAAKRAAMRAEWAGFKHVSDDALDTAIAQFEANGMTSNPRPMGVGPV